MRVKITPHPNLLPEGEGREEIEMTLTIESKKMKKKSKKGSGKLFEAKIYVTLKKSVLDPQGKVILQALHSLSFKQTEAVRVGKYFEIRIKAKDLSDAKSQVAKMCGQLLANTVIEQFTFDIGEVKK